MRICLLSSTYALHSLLHSRFLRCKLLKYIDITAATNSSSGLGRTFESCWVGQKFSSPILLNQRIDYVTVTAC